MQLGEGHRTIAREWAVQVDTPIFDVRWNLQRDEEMIGNLLDGNGENRASDDQRAALRHSSVRPQEAQMPGVLQSKFHDGASHREPKKVGLVQLRSKGGTFEALTGFSKPSPPLPVHEKRREAFARLPLSSSFNLTSGDRADHRNSTFESPPPSTENQTRKDLRRTSFFMIFLLLIIVGEEALKSMYQPPR